MINNYEDLDVWKNSIELVTNIYKVVKILPREELYALSDQIRRAAVSIPSNIAEGQQRQSTRDYIKFLYIAKGSLGELKTQLIICEKLSYLTKDQINPLLVECDRIGMMLNRLINRLMYKINSINSASNKNMQPINSRPQPRTPDPETRIPNSQSPNPESPVPIP